MAENRKKPCSRYVPVCRNFVVFGAGTLNISQSELPAGKVLPLIVVDAPQLACLAAKALGDAYWIEGDLGIVYAHLGRAEDARRILQVFTSREARGFQTHVPPEFYLALGDREHAALRT